MKPREIYVEFVGDPMDDDENYKRYCGSEKFNPVGHDAEVVHFIEKSAYSIAISALKEAIKCIPASDGQLIARLALEKLGEIK